MFLRGTVQEELSILPVTAAAMQYTLPDSAQGENFMDWRFLRFLHANLQRQGPEQKRDAQYIHRIRGR